MIHNVRFDPDAYFQHAISLHESGRLDEALQHYRVLFDAFPKQPLILAHYGIATLQAGHLHDGVVLLRKSLKLDPKQPEVWMRLGAALLEIGNAKDAVHAFDKTLEFDRTSVAALYQKGRALLDLEQHEAALDCFGQVIQAVPDFVMAHAYRSTTLKELKNYEEAFTSYSRVIALAPSSCEVYNNRGDMLLKLRRYDDALADFNWAIELNSQYVEAYKNKAIALHKCGRYMEALAAHGEAIVLDPMYAEAFSNRGNTLIELGRFDEALADCERAIELAPDMAEAFVNRSNVLIELGRLDEALADSEHAIRLAPDMAEAFVNRGNALIELGRLDEAMSDCEHAIRLNPSATEAYLNRGVVLSNWGCYEAALVDYAHAIGLNPEFAEAHWSKATRHVLMGNYLDGWSGYEWRWKLSGKTFAKPRSYPQPYWLGAQPIDGKTLLIWPEQGLGDSLQCVRYVGLAVAAGARVVLEAPAALMPVLKTLPWPVTLVESGAPLPQFDFHTPMMSLPLAFKTDVESIPAPIPYIAADEQKQNHWQGLLGQAEVPRIGLVWSGSTLHKNDRNRSIDFAAMSVLLDLPLAFHCLQKEVRPKDEAALEHYPQVQMHCDTLSDFSDTAALVEKMDLIITVDTSVAHLAGAMGKPVWILLPFSPDYRWFLEREDSPWYPTAKLFRQPAIGDWTSVVERVKAELAKRFA